MTKKDKEVVINEDLFSYALSGSIYSLRKELKLTPRFIPNANLRRMCEDYIALCKVADELQELKE